MSDYHGQKKFADRDGDKITLGHNRDLSRQEALAAVYISIDGLLGAVCLDLDVAKELHAHLGVIIAEVEDVIKPPKNSAIIKALKPGSIFHLDGDPKTPPTAFLRTESDTEVSEARNGETFKIFHSGGLEFFDTNHWTVVVDYEPAS